MPESSLMFVVFFSSRRRHTIFDCDWSSDVCSSDLGKVRALATTGKVRSSALPNVPTMSEAGVPGYEAVIWLGIMAPKGTPPDIVRRLKIGRASCRERV